MSKRIKTCGRSGSFRPDVNPSDEYYTRYVDIAAELPHHWGELKGKVVYCPCDGPESQFVVYFREKYHEIGLKGLIYSAWSGLGWDLFSQAARPAYVYRYNGIKTTRTQLQSDGSFLSEECTKIACSEADVIVSNPPFSLAVEWLKWLFRMRKEYLVIGALSWIMRPFFIPRYLNYEIGFGRRDVQEFDGGGGSAPCLWYTNLTSHFKPPLYTPGRSQPTEEHPREKRTGHLLLTYADYMPLDYYGPMYVPISFIPKLNRDQFEVLGFSRDLWVGDQEFFARYLIQRKPL